MASNIENISVRSADTDWDRDLIKKGRVEGIILGICFGIFGTLILIATT